jgi:hypothetical protein
MIGVFRWAVSAENERQILIYQFEFGWSNKKNTSIAPREQFDLAYGDTYPLGISANLKHGGGKMGGPSPSLVWRPHANIFERRRTSHPFFNKGFTSSRKKCKLTYSRLNQGGRNR